MSKLRYLPVNWVDGMKINKNHFIETENALFNKLYNTMGVSLTPFNYGLLPMDPQQSGSIEFSVDIDDQRYLRFRMVRCNSITKGGITIDIDSFDNKSNTGKVFSFEDSLDLRDFENGIYYLILTVDPYSRVPVGNADPQENPPRNPFIRPQYKIGAVNQTSTDIGDLGGEFLPIGKVIVSSDGIELFNKYIPPCSTVSSHVRLVSFYNKLSEFWAKIESDIITIIGKIHQKQQQSTLSASVHNVSLGLLDFVNNNMVIHNWFILHQSPINMIAMVIQFSRVMRNRIEILSHKNKEELINYFTDWCNLRTGEFEDLLSRAINVKYNHEDINETLTDVLQLLEVMNNLFTTLSGLDYIGKRKQTGIFVKEEQFKKPEEEYIHKQDIEKSPRTSFLADD